MRLWIGTQRWAGRLAFEVMTLDVQTLFKVTIYVEAILGLLLLFVWAQNLALRAVAGGASPI